MAEGDFAQRAPGSTTVAEQVERDWLKFENIDRFNDAYITAIAESMVNARKASKSLTEAEVRGTADKKEFGYRENFRKFWSARGITVDDQASVAAWSKTKAKAVEQYTQLKMRASAPPLPKRAEPEAIVVEPIPEGELPPAERSRRVEQSLDIMDIVQWAKWDQVSYTPETLHAFMAEFVLKLTNALRAMSTDTSVRNYQLQQVQNLFMERLWRMYSNRTDVRDAQKAAAADPHALAGIRENIQPWMDSQWGQAYALAQKYR